MSLLDWCEKPRLLQSVARAATLRVFAILNPLEYLLEIVNDRDHAADQQEGANTPTAPFMCEFLDFVHRDPKLLARKRRWP